MNEKGRGRYRLTVRRECFGLSLLVWVGGWWVRFGCFGLTFRWVDINSMLFYEEIGFLQCLRGFRVVQRWFCSSKGAQWGSKGLCSLYESSRQRNSFQQLKRVKRFED